MVYYNFETKTLVGDEPAPIYNPKVSLGHIILHHLNKFPANVFQVCADDGIETTCGEVARLSKNFAKNLLKEGFKESDVVGIVAQNSSQVTSVIFGCFMIATPISAVNSKWDDFTVVFGITEPKIIFCDRDVAKSVKNYVESKEMNAEIVILTDEIDGFRHVSEFFAEVEGVKM